MSRDRLSVSRAGRIISAATLFLAALGTRSPAPLRKTRCPTGFEPPPPSRSPATRTETDAVVLLDEITYTVAPDGNATEHRRHVIKILRPQGREDAVAVVRFDADTKLLGLHVWSIGPDGHAYTVKDKDINEFGYPGQGNLYADDRFKVAHAPGADPGGIVAYEYDQRMRPYLTEKTWFFQGSTSPPSNRASPWSFRPATPTARSGPTTPPPRPSISNTDAPAGRWTTPPPSTSTTSP